MAALNPGAHHEHEPGHDHGIGHQHVADHGHGPRHDHGPGHDHGPRHDHGPGHDHGPRHDHSPRPGSGHQHGQGHGGAAGHEHRGDGGRSWAPRLWHELAHLTRPHSHDAAAKVDRVMEASAEGVRTLWISLVGLGPTAVAQAAVVAISGSVALLGDTIHNAADALTALPLGVAFLAGRRPATGRFTYGFGRRRHRGNFHRPADRAVVGAGRHRRDQQAAAPGHGVVPARAVAAAAVIDFVGNEWVARYRIRVGRAIGSAALVADGLHARTDGFTSLAVLLGAAGAALGWQLGDPVIGLVITVAILFVLKDAAQEVFRRLMDAVDPALLDTAESALRGVDGVVEVSRLRMRWIGHRLRAEVTIVVDGQLSVRHAHRVDGRRRARAAARRPRLTAALVHADPASEGPDDPHALLAHHRRDERG